MPNNKIKIAILHAKYCGPVVTSINDMVVGLDRSRFDVTFIYLSGDPARANHLRDMGMGVHYLASGKRMRLFHPLIVLKLVRFLKENDFVILHCHAHKAAQYGAIAGFFLRHLKVFAHVHGLRRSQRLRRKAANYLYFRRIDRFITVSRAVKDDLIRGNWNVRPTKVTVLPNSVNCDGFAHVAGVQHTVRQELGIPAEAFVFGAVGRLAKTKGLSYLLEAFSRVHQKHPRAHLLLVGQGPEEASCRQRAAALGVSEAVCFSGFRKDVDRMYAAMNVFALSSIAEGMPRALLEAMAAGVPCIGTRVGGVPEILEQNMLVEAADAAALAAAMMTLIEKPPQELKALAAAAAEKARSSYSHEVGTGNLENIYLEALNRTNRKAVNSAGQVCESGQVYG